jgi:hypothetical protein
MCIRVWNHECNLSMAIVRMLKFPGRLNIIKSIPHAEKARDCGGEPLMQTKFTNTCDYGEFIWGDSELTWHSAPATKWTAS